MSAILERAKAHYREQPRLDIRVPEWGTPEHPAVVTWSKLTVHDQEKIYAPSEGRQPSNGTVRLRAVILKACDANGARLFDEMAEHDLRYYVDGDVIGRIANAILFGAGLVTGSGTPKTPTEQVDDSKNV